MTICITLDCFFPSECQSEFHAYKTRDMIANYEYSEHI
jgi:hypothetical protein